CLSAAIGIGVSAPAWSGPGWVARDNVCLNLQSVSCLITIGDTRDWTRESIWAVNNVCASVFGDGLEGIPRAFQNQVIDFGLVRRNVADGQRNVYEARGNIYRGPGDLRVGESYLPRGVTVGVGLGPGANWSGLNWSLSDNLMIISGLGTAIASWSSRDFPAVGDA